MPRIGQRFECVAFHVILGSVVSQGDRVDKGRIFLMFISGSPTVQGAQANLDVNLAFFRFCFAMAPTYKSHEKDDIAYPHFQHGSRQHS